MANSRFAHEYQKSAVNGASPLHLVVMLYDGGLRFMEAGRHAIIAKDLTKQNDYIQRAQKIVLELMSCLDIEKGQEIAKNLLSLYSYVLNELVLANMNDDVAPIDRAIRVMSDLRESWSQLENSLKDDQTEIPKAA